MGGKNLIKSNRKVILEGMRDGIPIGLGYLAVSFSLGIAAKTAGLNAFQSFLASLLCNASAGEYSGFTVIAADSSYFVIALATLVANARISSYELCVKSAYFKGHLDYPQAVARIFCYRRIFRNFNFTVGQAESFLYLRCNSYRLPVLGIRQYARHNCRQSVAASYCQRTKRCTFRNVPCNHHSAVKKEQNTSRNCTCQLCGKFCICIYSRHQSD